MAYEMTTTYDDDMTHTWNRSGYSLMRTSGDTFLQSRLILVRGQRHMHLVER